MFFCTGIAGLLAWTLQPQWIQVRNMAASKDVPEDKKKYLLIGVSSDRGLCGAIHSSIAKQMKSKVATLTAVGKEVMHVGIGDKIRGVLHRTHSDQFLVAFKEMRRKPPTFGDVSVIALELLNSGYEFDDSSINFNQFRSVISYKTEEKPIFSLNTIASAESMSIYNDVDADVLQNYQEYNLANSIYYSLKESTTSEQSARMTAMDNTSKNASEIIDKLTLTFNCTRQAVITKDSGLMKIKFHPQTRGKKGKFSQLILFIAYCYLCQKKLFLHCFNY
uniref:F-ATPase gamma subunit n=1 Tax=Rhinopithecus roxellana TaxID=61622 RepID=A0A2K6QPR5_RHIRO